ncbi:MAG: SH3 domain-containing protein [Clostridia bacterium]|nr:SH3 domain-containing protein [Clostridia bacterium]
MSIRRISFTFLSLLLTFALLASAALPMILSAEDVIHRPIVLQFVSKWRNYTYGGGTLYDTGCGMFSIVNAVGWLTGNEMSVTEVASWGHSIGGYNPGTSSDGTYRLTVYPKLQAKYGATYGFTVDCGSDDEGYWAGASSSILQNHLANGGAAIIHVPGHFIAALEFDKDTKYYHIYESAPSSTRGTNGTDGDIWRSVSQMSTGGLKIDWFCLLTKTGSPINRDYGQTGTTAAKCGTYRITADALNVRSGPSVDYGVLTTVEKNDLVKVTELASNGWGRFEAPSGVEGWSNVTGYASYIGVDAMAYDIHVPSGVSYTFAEDGSITITNTGSAAASASFILPQTIGTWTTPYFGIKATPLSGSFGFALQNRTGGYTMIWSGGKLTAGMNVSTAITMAHTSETDLAPLWSLDAEKQIDCVRIDLAPASSVKIDYCYFAASAKTVTDTSYNLARPQNVTPGDVTGDGAVTTGDARAIVCHLAGSKTLDASALLAADYNGDGEVTTSDVRFMLQALAAA